MLRLWWTRLLRGVAGKDQPGKRHSRQFRKGFAFPRLEVMEDRTLPSGVTHLVFGQQPTDTVAGSVISPPVSVLLEDQSNNVVGTATQNVSVAIANNVSGGTLSGTTPVAARAGVATFGDLSIDQPGAGYTLAATALIPGATGGANTIDHSDSQSEAPALGVVFTNQFGSSGHFEIEAKSFQWSGSSGGGAPSLHDFQIDLGPVGSVDPEIWGVLAGGATFDQVTINQRNHTINPELILTYKLFNAKLTSFQTGGSQTAAPDDVITLSFTRIEEDYFPQNPDGSQGTPVVVSYDLRTDTGGARAIDRSDSTSEAPALGVTFTNQFGSSGHFEIEARSFQWGGSSGGGAPNLQDFQIDLGPVGS
ncbi:MAG TPA: type VI secretion system tube protein Hcp, partial [Gemmataceae bacterium]|nr:type VI secretion system tube protein Hcp [Gemmataceae bacterium]